MINKYLLDTHILIWLLDEDDDLNKNVRDDTDYFQYPYYVSVESLREIVILQSLKKISLTSTIDEITADLQKRQISILPIELAHIKTLEKLPTLAINEKKHEDPFDRLLIAQSIANKYTIISSDSKFPFYKNCGLKLLVNEK
ncbi:MAG: type II toxin-antitoxin system VapC family toxin [Prevotellaceae bacterium]|jgi:PIN domain nuclease of toxin-antitoxin system|nr:type II toxin-antitoxin system VapC family toxin [Prevotellaceae bacterium]